MKGKHQVLTIKTKATLSRELDSLFSHIKIIAFRDLRREHAKNVIKKELDKLLTVVKNAAKKESHVK